MYMFQSTVRAILFFSLLISIAYMCFVRADQFLKYKAVDDCAKIARVERVTSDQLKELYPHVEFYKNCLTDKKIK